MILYIVFTAYSFLTVWPVNGFNINDGINNMSQSKNQHRQQLNAEHSTLTDVGHHLLPTHQDNTKSLYFQRLHNAEVASTQHPNSFASAANSELSGLQNNVHLTRTDQHHGLPQQQLPNTDLHIQNFLVLRNYATQQALPHVSHINTQFEVGSSHSTKQQQQNKPKATSDNVGPFQQSPYSLKELSSQQRNGLQQSPLQEHKNFVLSPKQGIVVPQTLPYVNSDSLFKQQYKSPELQQRHQEQPFLTHQQKSTQFLTAQSHHSDQDYKQKAIQKHEKFVQKQYEKSLNKVRQQHEDFLNKQQAIRLQVIPEIRGYNLYGTVDKIPHNGRPILPAEYPMFSSALEKYNNEHQKSTNSTPAMISSYEHTTTYSQNKETESAGLKKTIDRAELLKQLKAALAETPTKELGNKSFDEMDIVLPNGQRVQVVRTRAPNIVQGLESNSPLQVESLLSQRAADDDNPSTKIKELGFLSGSKIQKLHSANFNNTEGEFDLSKLLTVNVNNTPGISNGVNSITSSTIIQSDSDDPPSLEELAKRGLIPEGYEIEGISSSLPESQRKSANKYLEKKATYVYLEEQKDGSFKIQGVKANGEKETKQTGAEVESILKRIRSGDIRVPPSVQRLKLPNDEEVEIRSGIVIKTTTAPEKPKLTTTEPPKTDTYYESSTNTLLSHTRSPLTDKNLEPTSTPELSTGNFHQAPQSLRAFNTKTSSGNTKTNSSSIADGPTMISQFSERLITEEQQSYADAIVHGTENRKKSHQTHETMLPQINHSENLIQIFKSNGFYAMAKYLRQSGLDNILNETGPYTIFVPTDKAFKNLLVQLGGPERAEEKFKANPRLLSGLLLHHVIPGAFEIANLQDEMTGVSLAGTQLRVNQYTMHDQEWNDVTLTTINGAMIVLNKRDIKVPQGIAHAVDRVMFPLPVGDLLQTLQSDRDNRFATFLKILYTSGLSEKLQSKGIKTYSIFAPVDKSFNDLESDRLENLFNNKEAAEEFAMKHIVPGTLFSAGMRFYQVKDSLLSGKTVILQKTSAGKIKVNDSQMVTSNIPATNGVIHAIDGLLA